MMNDETTAQDDPKNNTDPGKHLPFCKDCQANFTGLVSPGFGVDESGPEKRFALILEWEDKHRIVVWMNPESTMFLGQMVAGAITHYRNVMNRGRDN